MKRFLAGLVLGAVLIVSIGSTTEYVTTAYAAEISAQDETAAVESEDEYLSVADEVQADSQEVISQTETEDVPETDVDETEVDGTEADETEADETEAEITESDVTESDDVESDDAEAADEVVNNGEDQTSEQEEESSDNEDTIVEESESSADSEIDEPVVEEYIVGANGEDFAFLENARAELKALVAERDVFGLVYLTDSYPIKAAASSCSDTVVTVQSAQTVYIQDVEVGDDFDIWYKVSLLKDDTDYIGYMQRSYLAISDVDFLAWEENWGIATAAICTYAEGESTVSADIATFPESYQSYLTELKQAHPNWTFVKQDVGLDWKTVVKQQSFSDISLISESEKYGFTSAMHNGSTAQAGWYYASEATIKYFLDPRNWIKEDYIFMFELLSYNETQKASVIKAMLKGTFMESSIPADDPDDPDKTITYYKAIYNAGKAAGVSPIHLASRLIQEQGIKGKSQMISGTYDDDGKHPELYGYYNYFNIGAPTGTVESILVNGLSYAKLKGWDTRLKSIQGGATALGLNYIKRGQDTLYLQKFDVDKSDGTLYTHQYMQNLSAPMTESISIRKAYVNTYGGESTSAYKNSTFVFKIPVYNDMPSNACAKPTKNYSICLSRTSTADYSTANGIYGSNVYIDGVAYKSIRQNGLMVTYKNNKASVATMYKYNSDGGYAGMYVWLLNWNESKQRYDVTEMPELENLLGYHGFSIRITGDTGIRMKSSISKSVRKQLLKTEGISGYRLKEYGTIYMTKANNKTYPLVKGGEKTAAAMAYGKSSDGTKVDNIYETVDERYRFTVVLTKLPATHYKTDLVFRSYAVLKKDGKNYIVYGPSQTRNMYNLAKSYIDGNYYSSSSSEYIFLKSILDNAQ